MLAVVVALLGLNFRPAFGDWTPPADKVFTEAQLKLYMETTSDWLDINDKIMQDVQNATTTAGRIAAVSDIDQKKQDCFARHHISDEEYDWLAQRTVEAFGAASYFHDAYDKSEADLQQKTSENKDRLAKATEKKAAYEAALQNGTRVLMPDDRDAMVKQAKSDEQAATDDANQQAEQAKAAAAEAAQHDADAKAADDLANNPPSDISADDKASYIDGKKQEAQAARDAAKDARDRQAEEEKASADSLAKAAMDEQIAEHPEVPQGDDDKASVKADDQAAIAQADADIADCKQTDQNIALVEGQLQQSKDQMEKDIPPQNVELMTKYLEQYKALFQRSLSGGASTQPSQ
jgi:hypothetical protein